MQNETLKGVDREVLKTEDSTIIGIRNYHFWFVYVDGAVVAQGSCSTSKSASEVMRGAFAFYVG